MTAASPSLPSPMSALVTGGARGIGAAISSRLAADGVRVTLCDKDREAGETLAASIGASFAEIDACDTSAIALLCDRIEPIHVLVNNIGADQHAFFTDTAEADWRRLLDINLISAFAFTHGVLPAMQKTGWGRIVNISSEAGRMGSRGGAVYAAAKAGLIGFTRSLARENVRYGITANAVLPGPVNTPMVEEGIRNFGDKLRSDMENLTLLKRLGRPEEVAAAVSFLASADASFITGEALGVSGGMGCGS